MFMHLGSYFGPGPAKYSVPPKQGSQQQASTPWLAQLQDQIRLLKWEHRL